ncbi:MAG TPA: O-antigen ligase family protein [Solirubrobacterales bacterium]|nr:O-antigen ligase family protein [Solirubrobacterales bacterium]
MPAPGPAVAVVLAGVLTGVAFTSALQVAGPKGAVAPLVLLLCVVLLRFPEASLGLLLAGTVLAESEAVGVIPSGERFYEQVVSSFTAPDVLLLFGLAGVLLRFVATDLRPRLPDPLTIPLIVLGMAALAGVATGFTGGVPIGDLFHRGMHVGYLILVPLLTVNVLRDTRALKIFAVAIAAFASLKGLTGLYAALAGVGGAVEDETATFLSPLPNMLMLVFLLGAVAARVRKVQMPTWMLVGAPVAALALLLSYRRSFWIAAVFTLIVVVVIASRRRGRAVVAICAVGLALTIGAAATIGSSSSDPSSSPLAERAQTIAPGSLGSNRGDRYRIDERANVIENIEAHPLTGIGLGVEWEVHQPLAEAHDRRYAHVAFLWFWLAFGPLGAIAYVALLAAALATSVKIWRRHPDPAIQACAIACFGSFLALGIVELTATFTGVEPRLSLLVGGLLGWLAAAWHDLPAR